MDTIELREYIKTNFSIDEVKSLCEDLGISFDDLGQATRDGAARELVGFFQRRSRLQELIDRVYAVRPMNQPSNPAPVPRPSPRPTPTNAVTKILFLAADPSDQTRLRLGQEYRDIGEELQKAQQRERYLLTNPVLSVRAKDFTGALINTKPQIVHFSGHGSTEGALILEDAVGKSATASAATLEALFKIFSKDVQCVVLNACYSKTQAKAIVKHIPYVIGMKKAIGDEAAIAFAIGFYQALGGGMDMEQAFELGKIQIGMSGIDDETKTPILHKKVS